ncbi:hypothetical protein ASPVEDRAFT_43532 [Aspergillus versicolor CBS 583.65]|uniref:Cysteine dioxygenase n=1 Tax=Aspergillus versicolor CBS 583.65 TaxID=1036611 RepID=A0A1L9PRG0_ASPVE|nr:uncharacterized protein ASPVEDRAFT_43532 [Aspergillus versicolor CBS 583.65]OJJ04083.1 hypothetical protein ASPVEDRAFT_43532 [Aspergillus versicolor CBS 583.65]
MPYLTSGSDSPSDPGEPSSNTFEELVQDLSIALGPTSGLDSDDVDPLNIQRLMERYTSNQDDWLRFALGDSTRSYTRNLIDEGNGKSNLLILVWNPGRSSAIHDHANAHCVMKVLKGTLQETLYTWPDQERIEHGQVSPPQVKKVTTYGENQVTYMSDKLGLHKIHNPDPNNVAISLHRMYSVVTICPHPVCLTAARLFTSLHTAECRKLRGLHLR